MTGLHRKKPKVYKKCNIIDIRHEPKGEEAHNYTNQSLYKRKTGP